MSTTDQPALAVPDPLGLITDLMSRIENHLDLAAVRAVVFSVASGRAKSLRRAEALAARTEVLSDGRAACDGT
ncbi:hypothetical protein AB0N09_41770 [Streptomyces erythrochromogenes]|uniref:hypothetical protein n=1 Tax=Streptomyces erythrochromogenes TaxID=285574 RepID=UPI0034414D28